MSKKRFDTLRLRVLHTKGLTVGEIAEEMKTDPDIIEQSLRALGYKPLKEKPAVEPSEIIKEVNENMGRGKNITTGQIAEMRTLKEKGWSQRQIAEKVGVSKNSVKRYTKDCVIKENEPAAAATTTSSEEVSVNTSTKIITHIELDVKTARAVSVAIKERLGTLINIASDSYHYDGFDKIKDNLDDICILKSFLEKLEDTVYEV